MARELELRGKMAFVMGTANGNGRAAALALADAGAQAIAADVSGRGKTRRFRLIARRGTLVIAARST